MADFSALKTAIQANIRTNGNEEITGAILQDILLSMVSTMGDGAINTLAEALQAEITNRQNAVGGEATTRAEADSELSGRINAEAQARSEADTQLGNSITAITTRLNEGYVYAGIATPSTNPGTPAGKVFYIALQAGTYTNFSSLAVTQGITILKYNGTAWSQEQLVAIDDEPTAGSNNLVKSGGVAKSFNTNIYTDNAVCNSFIKELYLYKKDGTSISGSLFIKDIYNKYNTGSAELTAVIIKDSTQEVCAFTQTDNSKLADILVIAPRNDSNIWGYIIIDSSAITTGSFAGINTEIKEIAYGVNYSPSIKDYIFELQERNYKATNDRKVSTIEESIDLGEEEVYAENVETTTGKYLYRDGITVNDLSGFAIAEIPIGLNDVTVKVTATHFTNGASLTFRDASNNKIGSVVTVNETIYNTVQADIPGGAVKALTTYKIDNSLNVINVIKKKRTVNSEFNYIDARQYESTFDVTRSIGIERGSANLSDGTVTQNNAFGRSGKVDVSSYDFVLVYTRIVSAICYVKWYDINNSEVLPRGNGDSSGVYKYMRYDKPLNAVYAEVSVIDYSSDDYFVLFGKKSYTKANDNNGFSQHEKILSLPNVTMIPIFGQSLSIGAAAFPIITKECKYPAAIMFQEGVVCIKKAVSYFSEFVPLREKEVESADRGETVASGCAEQLIELIQKENGVNAMSEFWNDHKFLFVSCGDGSKTIAQLMDDYYQGLVNSVTGAKNIAQSKGWSIKVPAVIYIQGETDQKQETTDYATYKAAIQNFASVFNTDVKSITGQLEDIKVIMYQTCSQNIVSTNTSPTFSNTAMDIPTAQMELVRDTENFCACNPAYILDHSTVEPIHLSATGEKMMGLYCGLSLKKVLLQESYFKGVTPQSYTISGNNIELTYNVPCPPLRFDVNFVAEVSHMGFAVIDSNDNDILSSVSVFDDKVTLVCQSSPLNCKLYYGFNGTGGYDGRVKGSRGNLCDSGNSIYNGDIASHRYSLSNYAYSFAKLLAASSGDI